MKSMQKRKNALIWSGVFLVLLVFVVGLYQGFGGNIPNPITDGISKDGSGEAPASPMPGMPDAGYDRDEAPPQEPGTGGLPVDNEKVIGTWSFTFETLEFQKASAEMTALAERYGGFIQSSQVYNTGGADGRIYKFAQYTFRIPKEQVLAFNSELKTKGHLTTENSTLENVSKYYRDTEARVKSLEAQEERLLALYENAERIEDIITIEARLNEVLYQKEMYLGELQYLSERIDYAFTYVTLQEVAKLSSDITVQTGPWARIQNALKDSLHYFQERMVDFTIFLIYLVPFLLVAGLLTLGVYKTVQAVSKGRKPLPAKTPEDKKE